MQNNLSIGKKLGIGIGLLAFGNILSLIISLVFVNSANRNFNSLLALGVTVETNTIAIARDMNYVSRLTRSIMLGDDFGKNMKAIDENIDKIVKTFGEIKEAGNMAHDASGNELIKVADASLADTRAFLDDSRKRMVALESIERTPESLAAAWKEYQKGATPLANKARESFKTLSDLAKATLKRETEEAENDLHRLITITLMINLGGLAISALVGFLLYRSIVPPLQQAAEIADQIAKGDLTTRIYSTGDDETGRLLTTLDKMQSELRQLVQQVMSTSQQLGLSARQMVGSANNVASYSSNQNEATTSAAAAVEEMTVSINHVSDNAEEAQSLARESETSAQQGRSAVQQAAEEISAVADAMRQSAALMETLKQRSNEITSIVNVIKEIADQTNLLALNAAIEAARAGEQGRGFAVVADEVRKLAERTTNSTQEISTMLGNLHGATAGMLEQIEAGVSKVASGREFADKADATMDGVGSQAQRVLASVSDIAYALKEQGQASNQVSNSVEVIARMTENNHQEIQKVLAAARSLDELSNSLAQSIRHLRV